MYKISKNLPFSEKVNYTKIKIYILLIELVTFSLGAVAQKEFSIEDSLKKIELESSDNVKIETYINIGREYLIDNPDSSILFYKKAEDIAKSKNLEQYLPWINIGKSVVLTFVTGNYPLGLVYAFEVLKYTNKNLASGNDKFISAVNLDDANIIIAYAYACLGNKVKSHEYLNLLSPYLLDTTTLGDKQKKILDINSDKGVNQFLAKLFILLQEYDTAEKYLKCILKQRKIFKGYDAMLYGKVLKNKMLYDSAINYLNIASKVNFFKDKMEAYALIAECYQLLNKNDSTILYANKVVELSKDHIYSEGELTANKLLYEEYQKKGIKDSAYKYIVQYVAIKDKVFNSIEANNIQSKIVEEQLKSEEELNDKKAKKRLVVTAIILSISFVIIIYFIFLYNQKKKIKQFEENRKTLELKAAQDLQRSLLPKNLPQRADLDIATFIRSSTEVGGDYYDFFNPVEGLLISVCGDATGHGVVSGMMVSVTKTALNGLNTLKPNQMLKRLNTVIKNVNLGILRMSLNIVEFGSDEITLSSAAMPPIYFYNANKGLVEEFANNGLPLGSLRDEDYVLEKREFKGGDVLVQFSDGLPEAPNLAGELYDYERMKSLIQVSCHLSAQEIINVLVKSVDEWIQGQPNPDDITLVVTKKKI